MTEFHYARGVVQQVLPVAMSDVFISYSKKYPEETEALVSELKALGLSVWWDTHLLPTESFKDRIVAELNAAAAVIVIWSPASAQSDWVYSEASRAKDAGKLIQVRVGALNPADVPPPFDALHMPLVHDRKSILGALARLGVIKGAAAESLAGVPDPGKYRPRPSPGLKRYWIGLACVALVAALSGAWWFRDSLGVPGLSHAPVATAHSTAGASPKKPEEDMEAARNAYLAEMASAEKARQARLTAEQQAEELRAQAAQAQAREAERARQEAALKQYNPNDGCQRLQATWDQQPLAKSIAVAASGECIFSHGHKTAADAEAEAIRACSSEFGGECRTLRTAGGDWTARDTCSEWLTTPAVRALAVAQNGMCGWGSGYNDVGSAKQGALDACEKVGEKCRITEIFEGDWSLVDTCKPMYKQWSALRGRGAFAVSQNGQCGYSYGYSSKSEALGRALQECAQRGSNCKVTATK